MLLKFLKETSESNQCEKLYESLIKNGDQSLHHEINVPVLEESLGMNQIFDVDLEPQVKKSDEPKENQKPEVSS